MEEEFQRLVDLIQKLGEAGYMKELAKAQIIEQEKMQKRQRIERIYERFDFLTQKDYDRLSEDEIKELEYTSFLTKLYPRPKTQQHNGSD